MPLFVHEALTAPEEVEVADLDRLRAPGWSGPAIHDAVSCGASMGSAGILFIAF